MRKKLRYLALGLALVLLLSGCSGEVYVPVERVDKLSSAAVAGDRFAGMVVSDSAVTVARETEKDIKDLKVQVGDQVSQGQRLFSYDTEALQLTVDKQELDMDRLEQEIKDIKAQIKDIKADIKAAKKNKDTDAETSLNIELRSAEMEQTQAEYERKTLKADIDFNKKTLKNVHVTSPIDGTIRSIDEANPEEYIVIQQTGAYRVKGLLNEMNMGMGIMEGVPVQIVSRLNPEQVWTGVVAMVDYENAEQNNYDTMYYGMASDSMSGTSSYPFYVDLDSVEGLLLGQHVYIQIAMPASDESVVYIPENYLMDMNYDVETDTVTAAVWAVGEDGRLEKRTVTLGEYDPMTGSYQVLEGLSFTDYVADPANPDCKEGAQISIYGQTGYVDDSGLTPEEKAALEASIAAGIEYGE